MRVLITNNTLATRAGSELYVRDVALGLLKRGHTPIAYSTDLGEVARDIRAATIPVIDNLDALSAPPDVIHGHHHLETMTALLRFPRVPAIYFCHGWAPWEEMPPVFPRILRYVAVDEACRDRLVFEHAIPEERIRLLLNFVDLDRFKPRGSLPHSPKRALIFSNYENRYTHCVHEACAKLGIRLDLLGLSSGNKAASPENVLIDYDIVFARGRSALESLAIGAAVILLGREGVGPMVTTREFNQLRSQNFGVRALRNPITAELLESQIKRYDARDAAEVSQMIRACAGRDEAVAKIISFYQEVIAENEYAGHADPDVESRAASKYLQQLGSRVKAITIFENRAVEAESARNQAVTDRASIQTRFVEQEQAARANESRAVEAELLRDQTLVEVESLKARLAEREQAASEISATVETISARAAAAELQLQRITNSLGWRLLSYYGPIKYKFLLPVYGRIGKPFRSKSHNLSSQGPAVNHNDQSPGSKDIFTDIYLRNLWGDPESVSGPGSTIAKTLVVGEEIPVLLEEFGARSLLDAGCGDFNWMRHVKLDLDRYIGADVVPELISENQRKYSNDRRCFLVTDITRDKLPRVDVILSRDCLVHFSFADIFRAIRKFQESGSTYLLTTSFASIDTNKDVNTGAWRPLNLQLSPFNFPEPLKIIDEKRTQQGLSVQKYLALWKLKDLPTTGE